MKDTPRFDWNKLMHDRDLWTAVFLWMIVAGVCVWVANTFAMGF